MKRLTISAIFAGLLALGWMMATPKASQAMQGSAGVTGDKYKFRLLYNSSHLPQEAQNVLKGAHGGFAVDMRPGKGETYFYLKGAGIIQISADMKSTRMIDTPPEMKSTNMHNAQIWTARDGQVFLTWPGNESNAVYTTTIDGKLVHTLKTPAPGTDVGHPNATNYFMGRGNFIPTDVEQLDGMFYITTGYSNLDYVLTAKVTSTSPFKAEWNDLAFGGRGTGAGQLGTGHGVTIPPGTRRVDVSDRSNSEIDRYTRYGQYISTLKMPYGSLPCDIYYLGNLAVVGALDGPNRTKGAPIYILENDELVSTISVKDDLGLEKFAHIHNAVIRRVNGKLYVIAQAWNPGDFAILEQVN